MCVGSSPTWGTMKKLVLRYKRFILKVIVTEDNTTIVDSFKIKSSKDMKAILSKIRDKVSTDIALYNRAAIYNRSISSMIHEWRVHNMLFSMGILKERTKDVDLNINQRWYIKALYAIISPLYLHFY